MQVSLSCLVSSNKNLDAHRHEGYSQFRMWLKNNDANLKKGDILLAKEGSYYAKFVEKD